MCSSQLSSRRTDNPWSLLQTSFLDYVTVEIGIGSNSSSSSSLHQFVSSISKPICPHTKHTQGLRRGGQKERLLPPVPTGGAPQLCKYKFWLVNTNSLTTTTTAAPCPGFALCWCRASAAEVSAPGSHIYTSWKHERICSICDAIQSLIRRRD